MAKCEICKVKSEKKYCPNCQDLIDKIDLKDLDTERKWLEELFMKRYNNFLLIFSLIVTAGFASTFHDWRSFPFYFGSAFLLLYWYTGVKRAYYKYDTLVNVYKSILQTKGTSVVIEIQERRKYNNSTFMGKHVGFYVGIVIPLVCVLFLLSLAILVNCCVIG